MRCLSRVLVLVLFVATGRQQAPAGNASDLRLVPFPKEVRLQPGVFSLGRPLVLEVPEPGRKVIAGVISEEFKRAGLPVPKVLGASQAARVFRLSAKAGTPGTGVRFRDAAAQEDYALEIRQDGITGAAPGGAGLFYAAQTLVQLIRANRTAGSELPCLTIRDWPSLRWRAFQDDMTRGPSSTLKTLQFEADLGAFLKLNLMTYYMEYQYAFKKHPKIGPPDGSLTPEDLAALVAYGKPRHIDILGNQQSFGHFGQILKHPEYAALREGSDVVCPIKEETYRLLDDMYGEVCPVLPFEFFNVCCDETWELGKGPSKELAGKIGVGGVYVRHIRRIHDILQQKYKKRMMMWGDIILQHPENLKEIPKDTIMLTWSYDARVSFEDQIVPFAKSGYEFFVCPGVSNWSRILPDFGVAQVNIRNFVRDGVKHGAIGMLNTDWEDDGEALNAVKWHADAWAAECAWNASKTPYEAFNRRVGAVLFGEKGDHFGQAVELLAKTHRMAGMQGMNNSRFWENDFLPQRTPQTIQTSAERLLAAVRPAIEHLAACREEAVVNAHVLDVFLFGARRMELIGRRMLDGLEAARLYTQAYEGPAADALPLLEKVESLVRKNGDAHAALGKQFAALWLSESKPYALDRTTNRYTAAVQSYDALAAKVAEARKAAQAGKPLPRPEALGLAIPDAFARRSRPHEVRTAPLAPEMAWIEKTATHRLGLRVRAGSVDRFDLPVEVEVPLPEGTAGKPIRAFCRREKTGPQGVLAELDPSDKPNRRRLVVLIPGRITKGTETLVHVYLGLPAAPKPLPQAVSTKDGSNGMKWIDSDKVRLLLGPEGAHVYRWEVKALKNRDLTEPGETGWAGFSDSMDHRSVAHKLSCVARGPALVRYQCAAPSGLVKTISLYGGTSWMEVLLNESVVYYWDFDNPKNFAGDGPTPGTYLFSNGRTGPVGKEADGVPAQVEAAGTFWGIKFNREKLALGMCTPEAAAMHHVAPGSGAGGVGIEQSPPASHFVTFAGLLEAEPGETMSRLRQTLDLKSQPEVILHAAEPAPGPK